MYTAPITKMPIPTVYRINLYIIEHYVPASIQERVLTLYDLGERISSVWPKFWFWNKGSWKKISYDRRIYESVDDRSLSKLGTVSKIAGKLIQVIKGL